MYQRRVAPVQGRETTWAWNGQLHGDWVRTAVSGSRAGASREAEDRRGARQTLWPTEPDTLVVQAVETAGAGGAVLAGLGVIERAGPGRARQTAASSCSWVMVPIWSRVGLPITSAPGGVGRPGNARAAYPEIPLRGSSGARTGSNANSWWHVRQRKRQLPLKNPSLASNRWYRVRSWRSP
jgi:hypothetical protein